MIIFFWKDIIAASHCVGFIFYRKEGIIQQKTIDMLEFCLLQLWY